MPERSALRGLAQKIETFLTSNVRFPPGSEIGRMAAFDPLRALAASRPCLELEGTTGATALFPLLRHDLDDQIASLNTRWVGIVGTKGFIAAIETDSPPTLYVLEESANFLLRSFALP